MSKQRDWDRNTVENARQALEHADNPSDRTLSTRNAVDALADAIREKLNAGWSRQEVVEFLAGVGVEIPLSTLRTYLSAAERASGSEGSQPKTAISRSQSSNRSSKRAARSKGENRKTARPADTVRGGFGSSAPFLGHEDV